MKVFIKQGKTQKGVQSPTEEKTLSTVPNKRSPGLSPGQALRSQSSTENGKVQHKNQKGSLGKL